MSIKTPRYFIPDNSAWPFIGSIALFCFGLGSAFLVNDVTAGKYIAGFGLILLTYMLFGWFGQVIRESESGLYSKRIDISFRWSMGWFIFSEVMFFSALFGALYYTRAVTLPELSSILSKEVLWPAFNPVWPTKVSPLPVEAYSGLGAMGLPAINTALLLASGFTLTIAHHALLKNKRKQLVGFLAATIALGSIFLGCQILEYSHAMSAHGANLTLASGIYGSLFYFLTGFHGFHVLLGTIMLIVMLGRSMKGHFTPEQHFAFEAAAWYWHFVDVVWLILFVFVYCL